jgi:hypothetical protein
MKKGLALESACRLNVGKMILPGLTGYNDIYSITLSTDVAHQVDSAPICGNKYHSSI